MNPFLILHLLTIVPVLLLGPFILRGKKGDARHKFLGKIWVSLMIVSCLLSFGITENGKFSWLHGLSAFTIFSVISAMRAIKDKNLIRHQRSLFGSYMGAFVAFIFAAGTPDRLIGRWFYSFFQ